MINGKTSVFGLLGNPVEHTLSPFIHNLLYEETQYNGTYNPFFVPTGQLEYAVKAIKGLSLKGLNVTVPYKIDVMSYLDYIDPVAKRIGACNTINVEADELVGYNTDWLGLKKSCDYEGIQLDGQHCVVIGAGGSARAVAMMCYYSNAASIRIVNRTIEKAEQICRYVNEAKAEDCNDRCEVTFGALESQKHLETQSILFQTTSVGMHPHYDATPLDHVFAESERPDYASLFKQVAAVIDIIYNPKETLTMRLAKEHGVKAVNGLGMLFFQAVCAFEIWTGILLEQEQLERALKKLEIHVYGQETDR